MNLNLNRLALMAGLLAIVTTLPAFAWSPAPPVLPLAATPSVNATLTSVLASDLMLRVAIDNNDAAKAGVPCADLGADSDSCATGRLILVNEGLTRITGDGWKLYLHSIRRLLKIDHPDFSLRHLTGDLYELTPRTGSVSLSAGQRLEIPFVAEYWLLRYSDVLPRPYVVVAGEQPAVLKHNDTDDETRYVEQLPGGVPTIPTTPAQKLRQMVERDEPLPAKQVAARALPSVMRQQAGVGEVDLRGVELSLPDLPPASVAALREHAATLGLAKGGVRITGALARKDLPADIAVPGGYQLRIAHTGVMVKAYDTAGLYYGVQTLLSLAPAGGGRIPAMTIEDAPRFGASRNAR